MPSDLICGYSAFDLRGTASSLQTDAFLHGALTPSTHEHNLIAVAPNEYLREVGVQQSVPYFDDDIGV